MQGLKQPEARLYSGMGIVCLVFLQCQGLLVCIPSQWLFLSHFMVQHGIAI